MKKFLSSKIWWAVDLVICGVWLALLWHEHRWTAWLILLPLMRIWTSFLLHRKSKLAIAPLCVITFFLLVQIFGLGYEYFQWFWDPVTDMMRTVYLLFGGDVHIVDSVLETIHETTLWDGVNVLGCLWVLLAPACLLCYRWWKGELQILPFKIKRMAGLIGYMIVTVIAILIAGHAGTYFVVMTLGICTLIGLMLFYKGELKDLLSRTEILYLSVLALMGVCYSCGVNLNKSGSIVLYASTLGTYALFCWRFGYKKNLLDMLLLSLGATLFWISPSVVGMLRIVLHFISVACVATVCVRFVLEHRKMWVGGMMFTLMGFIMPLLSMGYNPYTAIDYRVRPSYYHYFGGVSFVTDGNQTGLRDRYGMVSPVGDRIDFISAYKPYVKVYKEDFFQIYDIDMHRLLSEEWFFDIKQEEDSRYFYRLQSSNGEKRLLMPHWDAGILEMVDAKIVDVDSTLINQEMCDSLVQN